MSSRTATIAMACNQSIGMGHYQGRSFHQWIDQGASMTRGERCLVKLPAVPQTMHQSRMGPVSCATDHASVQDGPLEQLPSVARAALRSAPCPAR